MTDCNEDILVTARANVAERNNPAHWRAIADGEWDAGTLVQAEVARLLREPVLAEGSE